MGRQLLDACSFCGVLGGQLPQRVTRSVPDVRLCWKLATGRFVTPTARRVACSLATLVSLDDDRLHLDADFIEDALPQDRAFARRSEEHTSELQSPMYLVCRLLLEKKKT